MNDDELTALATKLRELREEFDKATARAAFEKAAVGLSPDQRARVELQVFVSDSSQKGDGKIGEVAGGDVVTGVVHVADHAEIYGPVIGANSGTVNVTYTTTEHQRRLDDYLTLLRQLAAGERARALCAPELPLTNGLPFSTLRLALARAAMVWEPETDVVQAGSDDAYRRSLLAGLLLPLVTTRLMLSTLRSEWALNRMSSPQLCVLVLQEGVKYVGSTVALDAEARLKVRHRVAVKLRDPIYAAGCARLLTDLTETEEGRDALAAAFQEYQASATPATPVPTFVHLAAATALGSAVGGGFLLSVIELLRPSAERKEPDSPPEPPRPTVPATPGLLRIPVTLVEWQGELEQRNERFGQPSGYWCYVRPGTYRMGGWERDQSAANLPLDGFWIARVPVTVAQYTAFIEAGGYRDSRWWTRNGENWLRGQKNPTPWRWRESPFNSRPRQAATGVRWYEAMAFCAWLSAQLARTLPRDYTLRLPTEAEWEAAAAYDVAWQRRTYPWGNDPPTADTVVFDRSWGDASPDVATCPAGAAPCGAMDMGGTVWEWTVSSYQAYPNRAHWLKEDFTTNDYDIPVRGGDYSDNSSYVRCGARYRSHPGDGSGASNWGGVRVCVSPRLAHWF